MLRVRSSAQAGRDSSPSQSEKWRGGFSASLLVGSEDLVAIWIGIAEFVCWRESRLMLDLIVYSIDCSLLFYSLLRCAHLCFWFFSLPTSPKDRTPLVHWGEDVTVKIAPLRPLSIFLHLKFFTGTSLGV